jgi:hypothetical protein
MQNPYRKPCSGRYHWAANQTDPLTWTVPSHMNSRAQPPRPAGAFRAAVRLLLGLLPCSIFAGPALNPETRRSLDSRPYLTVTSNLSIRFQEELPPPDLSVRPPAGAPPQPQSVAGKPSETAESRKADEKPIAPAQPDLNAAQPSADMQPSPAASSTPTPVAAPVAAPDKPAPAILPDDTKPQVHAEDFLPYFQFPGAHANPNDVTVAPTPPVPGIQPPSSATYRQQ